jgi:hypothetical protein
MADDPLSVLIVEKGILELRAIPLDHRICLLGASTSADVFIDNSYVSRIHVQITEEAGGYMIRDLDSKNGTFVNGTRFQEEGRLLEGGDRVELAEGQVVLRYQVRGVTLSQSLAPAIDDSALVVEPRSREVWLQGVLLVPPLFRKEFDVVNVLYQRRGEACSKDYIAAGGWPERDDGDVGDQEIEQTVRRVRLRIEPAPSDPTHVITVRGYAYKLSKE